MSFCFSGFSSSKVELTADDTKKIVELVDNLAKGAFAEDGDVKHKVKSDMMNNGMFEIIEGLYADGYIRPEKLEAYRTSYYALESDEPSGSSGILAEALWRKLYVDYINRILTDIKNNPQYCANYGEIASARQCCGDARLGEDDDILKDEEDGIVKRAIPNFKPEEWGAAASCKSTGGSCSSHSDCCSSLCSKQDLKDPNSIGRCVQPTSCYGLVDYKEECNLKTTPYCKTISSNYHPDLDFSSVTNFIQSITQNVTSTNIPVSCQNVNHESTGISECKSLSKSCSSDTDCCSDKCNSGKCIEKSVCIICIQNGNKTIDQSGKSLGFKCCPGTYESLDKRCIPKFPPYTLPEVKLKKKKPILTTEYKHKKNSEFEKLHSLQSMYSQFYVSFFLLSKFLIQKNTCSQNKSEALWVEGIYFRSFKISMR